jgi:hypothetical protein
MISEQRHLAVGKRSLEVFYLLNRAADVVAAFDNEEIRSLCETGKLDLSKIVLSCDDPKIGGVERSCNSLTS